MLPGSSTLIVGEKSPVRRGISSSRRRLAPLVLHAFSTSYNVWKVRWGNFFRQKIFFSNFMVQIVQKSKIKYFWKFKFCWPGSGGEVRIKKSPSVPASVVVGLNLWLTWSLLSLSTHASLAVLRSSLCTLTVGRVQAVDMCTWPVARRPAKTVI